MFYCVYKYKLFILILFLFTFFEQFFSWTLALSCDPIGPGSSNLAREIHFLQSLAPTLIKLTEPWFSNDPEDIDYHAQVCLIRVGDKLCRTVDLRIPHRGRSLVLICMCTTGSWRLWGVFSGELMESYRRRAGGWRQHSRLRPPSVTWSAGCWRSSEKNTRGIWNRPDNFIPSFLTLKYKTWRSEWKLY